MQKEIIVILNLEDGPGDSKYKEFENIITKYKEAGEKVLGYIGTNYSKRKQQEVIEDINKYINFYSQIDGFFFDEVSNKLKDIGYYRQIYEYIKSLGNLLLIINPGTKLPREYYNFADRVVAFEDKVSFLYKKYELISANSKDCFLVYSLKNKDQVEKLISYLVYHGLNCAYIINEGLHSGSKLSPYMDLLEKL